MSSRSIGVIHVRERSAERLVRDLVALVLEVLDVRDLQLHVREVRGELVERGRGLENDLGGARELREEGLLAGEQLKHGRGGEYQTDFTPILRRLPVERTAISRGVAG